MDKIAQIQAEIEQGVHYYEQRYQLFPNGHNRWELMMAYVRTGRTQQAMALIDTIPDETNDVGWLKAKAWCANQLGNVALAQKFYDKVLKIRQPSILWIHDLDKTLVYRGMHKIDVAPDDILMFCCAYNEMLRIPDFLRHYRELGVKWFFIIDNNSTDNTLEYLQAQPDVYVFWTDHSFFSSDFGGSWTNYLIYQYAHEGQWIIHADLDELMIYPYVESRDLHQFVQYLEQYQFGLVRSFLFNMFPADLRTQKAFRSGDRMLENAPYFYHMYSKEYSLECPYVNIKGGIFHKIVGTNVKTALVKYHKNFYFLRSSHETTPMRLADVSAVYLHFKMLGDFQSKAIHEVFRKEHAGNGACYTKYAQMQQDIDQDNIILSELDRSVRYHDSMQLVELGLLDNSENWTNFQAS